MFLGWVASVADSPGEAVDDIGGGELAGGVAGNRILRNGRAVKGPHLARQDQE